MLKHFEKVLNMLFCYWVAPSHFAIKITTKENKYESYLRNDYYENEQI